MKIIKGICAGILSAFFVMGMVGCSEASHVNKNLRKEADNFNICRRLVVFNLRTDTVLFQMEGLISINTDDDGDLNVTVQTGENEFKQHYVRLAEENCYIIEDITDSGTGVDKYRNEINFLPEWGYKITHSE